LIRFESVDDHEKCTHFLITDERKDRLEAMGLLHGKLYPLYHDDYEDDYYIVNEKGIHCYSVDVIVRIEMLAQIFI
jgi:uncharacterized protein YegJ (DUF2314 family)